MKTQQPRGTDGPLHASPRPAGGRRAVPERLPGWRPAAAAAAQGLGPAAGPRARRQALPHQAAQVRSGRGALRPRRQASQDPGAAGPPRGLPDVHARGDASDPAHPVAHPEELPQGVEQAGQAVRWLLVTDAAAAAAATRSFT